MIVAPILIPPPTFNDPLELMFLNRLRVDGESMVEAYIDANTVWGTCSVSRDAAKTSFPEYMENPTLRNRLVDAAASALADAVRRTLLSHPRQRGKEWVVLLTGAPASGKTRSASPRFFSQVEILHETILTSLPRSIELMEQTLTANRIPLLHLFYTDDPRINVRRMVSRARTIGRTVPLSYMAKTYVSVPQLVSTLHDRFGRSLRLLVTNNSETKARAIHHNQIERALTM